MLLWQWVQALQGVGGHLPRKNGHGFCPRQPGQLGSGGGLTHMISGRADIITGSLGTKLRHDSSVKVLPDLWGRTAPHLVSRRGTWTTVTESRGSSLSSQTHVDSQTQDFLKKQKPGNRGVGVPGLQLLLLPSRKGSPTIYLVTVPPALKPKQYSL